MSLFEITVKIIDEYLKEREKKMDEQQKAKQKEIWDELAAQAKIKRKQLISELEKSWNGQLFTFHKEIEDKLVKAQESLREAILLSEEYGVPFCFSLGDAERQYTPAKFIKIMNKFNKELEKATIKYQNEEETFLSYDIEEEIRNLPGPHTLKNIKLDADADWEYWRTSSLTC